MTLLVFIDNSCSWFMGRIPVIHKLLVIIALHVLKRTKELFIDNGYSYCIDIYRQQLHVNHLKILDFYKQFIISKESRDLQTTATQAFSCHGKRLPVCFIIKGHSWFTDNGYLWVHWQRLLAVHSQRTLVIHVKRHC